MLKQMIRDDEVDEMGVYKKRESWCRCGKPYLSLPSYLPQAFKEGLTDFKSQWLKYSECEDGKLVDNIRKNHDEDCAERRIQDLYAYRSDGPMYEE